MLVNTMLRIKLQKRIKYGMEVAIFNLREEILLWI
jgi:hypothetical protein